MRLLETHERATSANPSAFRDQLAALVAQDELRFRRVEAEERDAHRQVRAGGVLR